MTWHLQYPQVRLVVEDDAVIFHGTTSSPLRNHNPDIARGGVDDSSGVTGSKKEIVRRPFPERYPSP